MPSATLFVKFDTPAKQEAEGLGFQMEFSYPVYEIDVCEDEVGAETTRCLLANRDGRFHWIDIKKLLRAKQPKKSGTATRGNDRGSDWDNRQPPSNASRYERRGTPGPLR